MRIIKRLAMFILVLLLCLPLLSFEAFANVPPDVQLTGELEFPLWVDILVILLFSIPGIVVTIFSESLVALVFKMGAGERRCVGWTNLAPQLLMRIAHIAMTVGLSVDYLTSVLILELAVYIGEFLLYRRIMKEVATKKLLLFTIVANTVSLLLGILINDLILFRF